MEFAKLLHKPVKPERPLETLRCLHSCLIVPGANMRKYLHRDMSSSSFWGATSCKPRVQSAAQEAAIAVLAILGARLTPATSRGSMLLYT